MNLRPEEISSVIKEQIEKYSTKLEVSNVGTEPGRGQCRCGFTW